MLPKQQTIVFHASAQGWAARGGSQAGVRRGFLPLTGIVAGKLTRLRGRWFKHKFSADWQRSPCSYWDRENVASTSLYCTSIKPLYCVATGCVMNGALCLHSVTREYCNAMHLEC